MTVISDLTEKDLRWLKYLKIMTLCICDILKNWDRSFTNF